jgi:AMMECR1 domain-containing protein
MGMATNQPPPARRARRGSVEPRGVTSTTHPHKATSHRPLDSSVEAAKTDGKFTEHASDELVARERVVALLGSKAAP